jgi:hypothetical protein
MIYQRIACSERGWCNRKGPNRACSKRGQRPSGGIWWMRFRFGGRFVHESTRTKSKTLAREAERKRRRELEEKWNRIEKRSLPPTLNEAAKRWIEKRTGLASNTLETYKAA